MTAEKTALVSCMRNEGFCALKRIADHQGPGFAAILTPEQRRARIRNAA
ncbi:hypothetical protein [Thalassovita mangrovi]|uniref:Uncharacterized protein n=1 Tax=Thalassovita mangrovi TaxID=2692236 RepID=A0A6L8LLV7_9RHOB|nr:hypothetical protein [Thalassovita mangrovi]MYM57008.1 hypothetical protein [Thalassovita mangrovi]